jgi:regulatory protein YycI of two-component signal transduction system YycFG
MNIYSVNSTIYRAKKNGNDFQKFIDEQAKMILHQNKVAVYKAVVDGAVSGSSTAHNNQKLYAQLTGDVKDSGATTTHITLAIGINSHPNIQFGDEERGVIDVEPVIPRGK